VCEFSDGIGPHILCCHIPAKLSVRNTKCIRRQPPHTILSLVYRYTKTDDGPNLENIEDDDEYEAVADAFDEFLDAAEFDEIVGEDEI